MKKWIALLVLPALLVCILSGCKREDPLAGIQNPMATIQLSNGKSMRFELFLQDAPSTVANFVELAEAGC